ncbi:unnamed protein product [Bursaphelenchus okinawaensis]|uniref:Uncharacterized protein n=1 Tax=Bursaphelenchus okinawaensis TaxID=465554 RepID=A0A811JUZ9_9BILA|nr:unnamed protein product [Bursaphelenchus okinawaensis]CAG9084891.1 unnamed protein product [Bursaphelenchus okinawaensis]
MPPCGKHENGSVRTSTSKPKKLGSKKKYSEFEEIAYKTIQALNPNRKIHRREIKIDQVKEVVRRIYYGEPLCPLERALPSPGSVSSAASTSSSSITNHENLSDRSSTSSKKPGRKVSQGDIVELDETAKKVTELISKSLAKPNALLSFQFVKTECQRMFSASKQTNNEILGFVSKAVLKNDIDSNMTPEKNIQRAELYAILELYKIELDREQGDVNKVIAKLRYLNVLTSGKLFNVFVSDVLHKTFGKTLAAELTLIRQKFGLKMPPNEQITFKKSPSPKENLVFSELKSTNLEVKEHIDEEPTTHQEEEATAEVPQRKRSRKSVLEEQKSVEVEVEVKKMKVEVEEEERIEEEKCEKRPKKKGVPFRVDNKGSIASRRHTQRRLCVVKNSTGLIQPTARRSSTASFIQKQQSEMVTLRKRYSIDNFKTPALPKHEPERKKFVKKVVEKVEVKKVAKKPSKNILDKKALQRYSDRMAEVFEKAKHVQTNEVFYGRCNIRQGLFENTEAEDVTAKQKNRSGRSTKANVSDCLYFAHTLLNVHNTDPLASRLPKAIRCPSDPKITKIKKLVRHASRSRVIRYNKYLQRCKLRQLKAEAKAALA